MQISNTTTKAGIFQDIDFICGSDSTSYPLTDKARNVNRHYQKAIIDELRSLYKFQTSSDLTSLDTFIAEQQEYTLPSDLMAIEAIEIKDAAGNWIRLRQIDKFELSKTITDYQNVSGTPVEYDIYGAKVSFYPAPKSGSVTLTNGIKYHYQGEVTLFASTDTSPEPAIPELFHRILSYGASIDYLMVNSTQDKTDRATQFYEQARSELREYIGSRNRDLHVGIRPAHRTSSYE